MKERLKLAICATLLLLPWIFFDIDLGDQSYHSLGSWLMAFHPKMPAGELPYWFEQVPIWFSYFVDSLWWRVIGPNAPLVVVRLGWILFQVWVLLALYEAFRRLFPDKKVIWPLLLGLMAVNCAADAFVLSYYVVPPAFGALAFAFLAVGFKQSKKIFFFLSGIFMAFSIQARLPSALPLGACSSLIFFCAWFLEGDSKFTPRAIVFFLLGAATGILFSFLCLIWSGQREYFIPGIESFWRSVSDASNQRYSKGLVLERAIGHYSRIAVGAILFGAILLALEKFNHWRRWIYIFAAMGAVVLALAKYGTVLSMVIGGALATSCFCLWKNRNSIEAWHAALLLGAIACLSAFTLGTYLEGVQTFKYGLWLLVPMAFLLLPGSQSSEAGRLLSGIVIGLFLITRLLWPTFPFLERPIYRMNTFFQIAGAEGLLTYPDKALSITELVDQLNRLGLRPGADLLVYSGVPSYYPIAGIYLLTRTVPLLHDPGIVEYPGARWKKHKDVLGLLASQGRLPRLVVRQKELMARVSPSPTAMLKSVWAFDPPPPTSTFQWSSGAENGLPGELDDLLKNSGFRPIWENAYFVILGNS